MDRRSFIKNCGGIAVTTSGFSSLLLGCQTIPSSKLTLLKTDQYNQITVNKAVLNTAGVAILQATTLKTPIYLQQQKNGQYVALLLSCTHQQCTVSVTSGSLVCPCHGAKFDKQGKVLRGPAEKDLLALKLYEKDNDIIISLP